MAITRRQLLQSGSFAAITPALGTLAGVPLIETAKAQTTAQTAAPADLQWRHALSLFGDIKYPADFKQFDYVKADAPKGGVARLISLGTFDNFNIAVAGIKGNIAAAATQGPSRDGLSGDEETEGYALDFEPQLYSLEAVTNRRAALQSPTTGVRTGLAPPTAPAAAIFVSFTSKKQFPRRISTMRPVRLPGGSAEHGGEKVYENRYPLQNYNCQQTFRTSKAR